MQFRRYTQEQLIQAVKISKSYRQVLINLKINPAGANHKIVKNYIKQLNLDISHFSGNSCNKGKTPINAIPLEKYVSNEHPAKSTRLKNRLIKNGYFENKCYKCNLTLWNNQPIPTELHHIDGNSYNNNLKNLTILCPNCHAQTETYKGRNNKNTIPKEKQRKYITKKCNCGKMIHKDSKQCKICYQISRRTKERPTYEDLKNDINIFGYAFVAKKHKVTSETIKNWLKYYEKHL